MDNSTISGNTSSFGGGGIESMYSAVTLNQVTITDNEAIEGTTPSATATLVGGVEMSEVREGAVSLGEHSGGARSVAANEVVANGTIIAGNVGTDVGVIGSLLSDHSLIGTVEGTTLTDQGGTILGVDPVLGPLANNGGPTQTHELLHGQPGDRPRCGAGPGVPGERVRPAPGGLPPGGQRHGRHRRLRGAGRGAGRAAAARVTPRFTG